MSMVSVLDTFYLGSPERLVFCLAQNLGLAKGKKPAYEIYDK